MSDHEPPQSSTPTSRLLAKAYRSFRFAESGIAADEFHRDPCRHLRDLSRRRKSSGSQAPAGHENKDDD